MKTFIINALNRHQEKNPLSFHTPGHKNGRCAWPELKRLWGDALFKWDQTEITGLDNLQSPEGIIRESQLGLAEIHQVAFARYLLGGTTLGLEASLMATCRKKKVFVPRHAHRSIYHGLVLAEAEPIYLPVTLDPDYGIPLGVAPETLEKALKAHPDCQAMVVVNPTYHGITWKNEALIKVAKEKGLTVIVDEAHGPHFSFAETLPNSATAYGADLVIESYHKILPTLTQGSVLLSTNPELEEAIDRYLTLLQTTSPSYVILSSLECSAFKMAAEGEALLNEGLKNIRHFLETANYEHFKIVQPAAWRKDPFRFWLYSDFLAGPDFAAQIEEQGAYVEMADEGVLLLLPLNGDPEVLARLDQILKEIDHSLSGTPKRKAAPSFYRDNLPEVVLPIAAAFHAPKETKPLSQCLNGVAGGFLQAYPPGIPLLVPGERIDQDILNLWEACGHDPEMPFPLIIT